MAAQRSGPFNAYTARSARVTAIASGMSFICTRQLTRKHVAQIHKAHLAPVRATSHLCAQTAKEYIPVV